MNPESLIELAAWADGTMPDVEDSRRFHDACDPQTITELCQRVLDATELLKDIDAFMSEPAQSDVLIPRVLVHRLKSFLNPRVEGK
jgi:hypothetical protein